MKKKDLKTGMRAKLRNGIICVVFLNTKDGDVLIPLEGTEFSNWKWAVLDSRDDNLLYSNGSHGDIIEIYDIDYVWNINKQTNGRLLWKREEETEELTLEQVCKELGRNIKIIK